MWDFLTLYISHFSLLPSHTFCGTGCGLSHTSNTLHTFHLSLVRHSVEQDVGLSHTIHFTPFTSHWSDILWKRVCNFLTLLTNLTPFTFPWSQHFVEKGLRLSHIINTFHTFHLSLVLHFVEETVRHSRVINTFHTCHLSLVRHFVEEDVGLSHRINMFHTFHLSLVKLFVEQDVGLSHTIHLPPFTSPWSDILWKRMWDFLTQLIHFTLVISP